MNKYLNFEALVETPVKNDPYPHFVIEQALTEAKTSAVIGDFPSIDQGGSFNLEDVSAGPNFDALIAEIESDEFRAVIAEKLDLDLTDRPIMTTLRGYSRAKDGRIHTDSKTKLATVLIYLNEDWNAPDGRLRVLRNGTDMDNYVAEICPGPGTLFAFKVTDNCWHGYPSHEGPRKSIQVNYLSSDQANRKHRFFHGISARLKKVVGGK